MATERLELSAGYVRHLRDTFAELHHAPDMRAGLGEAAAGLADLTRCRVTISLVHGAEMVVCAESGPGAHTGADGMRVPLARWRETLAGAEQHGPGRLLVEPGADLVPERRTLIVPMVSRGRLLGAVSAACPPAAALPSEATLLMLDLLVSQLAVIVADDPARSGTASMPSRGPDVALRLSEEPFRLAFDNAPIGMLDVEDAPGGLVVTRINHQAGQLCGVSVIDAQLRPVDEVVVVQEGITLGQRLQELVEGDLRELRCELRIRGVNGTHSWVLAKVGVLPSVGGRTELLCQLVDINDAKVGEAELTRQAHYDALTGLPNRRLALDRLRDVVTTARVSGEYGALLFCDLDNFKAVNDEFGHLVGDEALVELARRLNSAVRKSDIAGRFGGDEFVIVASPVTVEETRALTDRVSETMSAPMMLNDTPCIVSISIGVAMITGDLDVTEVLRRADHAMYQARRQVRSTSYVADSA